MHDLILSIEIIQCLDWDQQHYSVRLCILSSVGMLIYLGTLNTSYVEEFLINYM